jgi:hypothetical protein
LSGAGERRPFGAIMVWNLSGNRYRVGPKNAALACG